MPEHSIAIIKQKFFNLNTTITDIKKNEYPHYEVTFTEKGNSKAQHTLLQGLTKDSSFGGLQTSFEKAQKYNFYDKQHLIYRYLGTKKESTLLHQDLSQIQIISEKKMFSITNIVTGAHVNGYNELLLTAEVKQTIQQLALLENELKKILIESTQANMNTNLIEEVARVYLLSLL